MARPKKVVEPEVEFVSKIKPIDPELCYDCDSDKPIWLVNSPRITNRPICNGCIVPYCYSLTWQIKKG